MREVDGIVRCSSGSRGGTAEHLVRVDADGNVTTLEHDPAAAYCAPPVASALLRV